MPGSFVMGGVIPRSSKKAAPPARAFAIGGVGLAAVRRPLFRLAAAVALAALLAPGSPSAEPAAGIAYAETERTFIGGSPPAFGPGEPDPSPSPRRRGLAALLPARSEGDAAEIAVAGAFAREMHDRETPRTLHHAFYAGWERIDDPAAGTAELRECDRNRVVMLDLNRRTYRIVAPQDEPLPDRPPARPGVVTAQIAGRLLPPAADGTAASGYEETATLQAAETGGACRSGSVTTTTYYTAFALPPRSCPVRPAAEAEPPGAVALLAASGCRPQLTVRRTGAAEPVGLLAAYRAVVYRPEPAAGTSGLVLGWLVERSDFTVLGPADAAQFEIPAGFTETRN